PNKTGGEGRDRTADTRIFRSIRRNRQRRGSVRVIGNGRNDVVAPECSQNGLECLDGDTIWTQSTSSQKNSSSMRPGHWGQPRDGQPAPPAPFEATWGPPAGDRPTSASGARARPF